MRVGYIPPMPVEVFSASPHEAENLWSAFALAPDRSRWLETARRSGLKDNTSTWSRCLYALARERDVPYVVPPGKGK